MIKAIAKQHRLSRQAMALTSSDTGCGFAEAIRVRDLRCHEHHPHGPARFCWPRQRCLSELARRPELIGNIQQWHPGAGPLLCFPGPTGDGVALTQGITADLAQTKRLNRCSHANQIEGIGSTFGITTYQGFECAVIVGSTVRSRVVDYAARHNRYLQ